MEERTLTASNPVEKSNRNKKGQLISLIGIGCNILLALAKMTIGMMSGMISIVADAVNNFSDSIASIVSLIGFKLSSRPADDEHPFGHARYEYISGLIVAFLVMLAGVELLQSSIKKIIHPEEISYSAVLFIVLALSILVKLGMCIFYRVSGQKIHSGVILAAAADSRNDVIATSAVLISAIVAYYTKLNLDGIIGTLVALYVLFSGVMLVRDTIKPLLGSAPDVEIVSQIESKIMQYEGVLGTHDLMVHDYGPDHFFASVHVEVPAERDVLECHEIIDKIEQDFANDMHIQLVIHYDPIVTSDERIGSIRDYLTNQAKLIDARITIHDLRIVPGENNTNVIFDCVIPREITLSEDAIVAELKHKLQEQYPGHTAVIKVDHSFIALSE